MVSKISTLHIEINNTDHILASRRSYASLILGGADRSRFVPTNLTISFATDDYIAPVAGVLSIIGMNTLKGTVSFSTSGAFLAAIDSSVAEMWLPRSICDKFESAFGLTYDSTSGLYIISNDETHSQLQALNPTITFQFGNGTSNLHSANVVLPYAAFDLQASWPTFKNSTKYFPLRRAANESQYTLGRVLLQEAYLMVDFERQNFTITQALFPDAHTTTDIAAIFSLSENRASKLGTGPITGIAIGGFGLVVIMAFLVLWYRRGLWRKRRRGEDPKAEDRIAQDEPEKFYLVSPELDSVACHELPPGALAEMGVPGKWEMPATTIPQELDSIPVSRT
jgi:hypothetical protein